MSTSLFAEQTSHSLLERPDVKDLFTIDINDHQKWYDVGLQLGIGVDVLEKIKRDNFKPHLCKRAMFREWINVGPESNRTWKQVIEALTRVDPKEAERVMQTIITETNVKQQIPWSRKPYTAQFPLQAPTGNNEGKNQTKSGCELIPMTVSGGGQEKRHTESLKQKRIATDGSCESLTATVVKDRTTSDEMEGDGDGGPLKKSDVLLESHHESEHALRGSFSADVYETASEDDSFHVFNSQHGGDAGATGTSTGTKGDQVLYCTVALSRNQAQNFMFKILVVLTYMYYKTSHFLSWG